MKDFNCIDLHYVNIEKIKDSFAFKWVDEELKDNLWKEHLHEGSLHNKGKN
jgi:hypothetical protein